MTTSRRQQPERLEQAAIIQLCRALGGHVYVLGTRRPRGDHQGTCQTPGLPDLLVFIPIQGRLTFVAIEVKAQGGRLRPAQAAFADHCRAAGIAHVVGGIDAVLEWLRGQGVVGLRRRTRRR